MSDAKAEVRKILDEGKHSIDEMHRKLEAVAGANKEKLSQAVAKLKAAHETFEDDAQECVVH